MTAEQFGLALAISLAVVGTAATALDEFMPGRSTTYSGYSQRRVDDLKKSGQALVFRYLRNCERAGVDAIVDQVWETADTGSRQRRLAYYTRQANPREGMTHESGIPGFQGLFTPLILPPARDVPPGEFSGCDFVDTNEQDVLYPSALSRADAETIVPTTAHSIAWEARASTPAQAESLAALWQQARAELRQKGPAWNEKVERHVSELGQERLEAASVRYRGTDGSEVTLEYRRLEGNPSVLAVLIAHKRLPKQPKVDPVGQLDVGEPLRQEEQQHPQAEQDGASRQSLQPAAGPRPNAVNSPSSVSSF